MAVSTMSEIKHAGTIKRDRRTKDRMTMLDAQIMGVLEQDHPQSVRHVFYRMTDPRLPEPVEKSDRVIGMCKAAAWRYAGPG
jgi:hypothetical protein